MKMKSTAAGFMAMACSFIGTAVLLPAGAQETPTKPVFRDAATHDSIADANRKAAEEKKEAPAYFKTVDPSLQTKQEPEKRSLLASSEIFCHAGKATLVPKGAVIHVPKNLADRLGMREGVKFTTFMNFMAENRSWITTTPVTRKQAEGKEPLPESLLKSFAKESRIVVATLQEGPISVLPPKVEESPAAVPAPTASTP